MKVHDEENVLLILILHVMLILRDMFPLLQIFLLIFTTVLFHICLTNPSLNYTSDYVPYEGIGVTFVTIFGPKLGKLIVWMTTLYQVLYLYLQAFSPSLISTLFPQISTFINPLPLTLIAVLGYIFMIAGGLGRIWCFRTLGKFFTFKITIRSSHKLIKTGLYAYVRHPSYTFVCILVVGMFLIHQRLANFFPNSRWAQNIFGPVGTFIGLMIMILILIRRVTREEEELAKAFGKEWTQYASKTKRFIPKVI